MAQCYPILVINGPNPLGALLSQRLAQTDAIQLFIADQVERRAKQLAQQLLHQYPDAKITSLPLDIDDPALAETLAATSAKLVMQTQSYSPSRSLDYPVAKACLAAKIHYIDLSEQRDVVTNIQQFHAQADANHLLMVSGAGIFPAISSAVMAEFRQRLVQIDQISIHASFGYKIGCNPDYLNDCGQTIEIWRNQQWESAYIGQELHAERYPHPVGQRWVGIMNPADLTLLPAQYPEAHTIVAYGSRGAYLQPWGNYMRASLQRYKIISAWCRWPRWLNAGCESPWLWMGSHRSAIQIRVEGYNQHGKHMDNTWYLLAAGQDILQAMIIPAYILAQKLARQELLRYGAYPCCGLLTLDEITAELKRYNIQQTYRHINLT